MIVQEIKVGSSAKITKTVNKLEERLGTTVTVYPIGTSKTLWQLVYDDGKKEGVKK